MGLEYTLYNHGKKEFVELGKRYSAGFQRNIALLEYLNTTLSDDGDITIQIISDYKDDELLKDSYKEQFPDTEN
jgi:hypothetical protein